MTEPRTNSGVKTLGIKVPDALHAQFTLVAQLDGISPRRCGPAGRRAVRADQAVGARLRRSGSGRA